MTVRDFMNHLRRGRGEVKRLKLVSENLYTQVYSTTKPFNEINVQSSNKRSKEDMLLDIIEIQEQINESMAKLVSNYVTFFRMLNMVNDPKSKEAIQLYYIGDMVTEKLYTLDEVAEEMNYSTVGIKKLIRKGIKDVSPSILDSVI